MKPLVLGHRGASAYAPENTLAAFDLAFAQGADGIELDVTLCKDGIPVIIHDDTVDRTTNGHGAIGDMTLAEIKQLDASYKFPQYRGANIPTLEEALYAVGKRGIVNVELKSTKPLTIGLEAAVNRVIQETGTADRILISSFNLMVLHRMALLNPALPIGLLYSGSLPIHVSQASTYPATRYTALHPRFSSITPQFVAWARNKKYRINTWTVDEPDEMRRLVSLGIDAIISNKPDVLRQVIG